MPCRYRVAWYGKKGAPAVPGVLKIGSMKDEVRLPANFDDVFDSLDGDVVTMFSGTAL